MTIHRTVFQVEVFSEGPLGLDQLTDCSDLAAIDYAITDGDCTGEVREIESAEVPAQDVQGHLERIGTDGGFFGDEYLDLAGAEPAEPTLASLGVLVGADGRRWTYEWVDARSGVALLSPVDHEEAPGGS